MRVSLLFMLYLLALPVRADVFDLTATVGGTTVNRSFRTVDDAADALRDQGIQALQPSYSGIETVQMQLDFRGVGVQLAYPQTNSTLLTFQIPELGIDQQFQGATRDDSQSQFKDYLKKNPELLERLQKQLVRASAVDPVAGNPNSLVSRSVQQDFSTGLLTVSELDNGSRNRSTLIGLGVSYSRMVNQSVLNPRDIDSSNTTLPFSYTKRFDKPGHELVAALNLGQTEVEGAKAYDAGLQVAYRQPVSDNWFIGMNGSLRATGSKDLGSGAGIAGLTVMSSYLIRADNWGITIGNMVGFYSTLKVKVGDTSYNPGIRNTVFRNGILAEQKTSMTFDYQPVTIEYYLIDTRYTGTKLYNRNQDEIGVTIGSKRSPNARASSMRGGLAYLRAPHSKGVQFSFGYWF
ncbi:hypothetical protein [Chitinivorax sp. B]|uniref:hypothetical protein n=1 Tax=Chitinivorax sp. B TaxID=2502235 RepID=UPI0010F68725|nr:hypothetical protein [Chitinivorax sp. B]